MVVWAGHARHPPVAGQKAFGLRFFSSQFAFGSRTKTQTSSAAGLGRASGWHGDAAAQAGTGGLWPDGRGLGTGGGQGGPCGVFDSEIFFRLGGAVAVSLA